MKKFMDENFLLTTGTAQELYHRHAAQMPVVDYHCHVSPQEIAEDRQFENITQVWLGGDHYKWRLMRSNGAEERLVTGDADDKEKFLAFAAALPRAIGNPLYHWTHLELQRYFDCDLPLGPATAEEIWRLCNAKLQSGMGVRKIIGMSGVTAICTTDDPVDSLEHHAALRQEAGFATKVLPAFRPDKAVNVEKPDFAGYVKALEKASGITICTVDDVKAALANRMDHFDAMGCKAADHGLDYVMCRINPAEAESALKKALGGEAVGRDEAESYKTQLLLFCGAEYARRGWVMQLHYGAIRSVNTPMFGRLGPDTGFDCISTADTSAGLVRLLDAIEQQGGLPKTILYSLNPADNAMLGTVIGCFQGTQCCQRSQIPGKVQHGSAWWFSDTKRGMEEQMASLADLGILGNFVGMLTDSRSFLSYTRHEYFRRILCGMVGRWVENGEYPADMEFLGGLVRDISYNNAVRYFGFAE